MPRGTCIYGITVASKEQGPVIDKTTTVRPQNGLSRSDFEISVAQDLRFAFYEINSSALKLHSIALIRLNSSDF